jgi:hypothetical protein
MMASLGLRLEPWLERFPLNEIRFALVLHVEAISSSRACKWDDVRIWRAPWSFCHLMWAMKDSEKLA